MRTHSKMQEELLPTKSTSSKMIRRFRHAWPVPGAERRPKWLDISEKGGGKGVEQIREVLEIYLITGGTHQDSDGMRLDRGRAWREFS